MCEKRLDGLFPNDLTGNVEVGGDLTVKGGEVVIEAGMDDYANIRSSQDAFGLDIEVPAGKRIRLLNGTKSWVEVDENGLEINASAIGQVGLRVPNIATNYEFTLPTDMGQATQVLTSDGVTTYWSTPSGPGGGGTVTSVDVQSLNPFLVASGGPITGGGVIGIDLNGALDVAHGGTGVTTSTGTGSVVLNSSPSFLDQIKIIGVSNGTVTIDAQSVAGTWNFNLPTDAGSVGQVLTSRGGGTNAMIWSTLNNGTVTSVGMTVPNFLSVVGSPITSSGTFALSYSGTPLPVVNGGTGVTTGTGAGSVVLSQDPFFEEQINIKGSSSGIVTIATQFVTGTWNFNLPTTAGNAGQVLTSQGGGSNAMTWTTPSSATGTVTSVGMTVPSFMSISGSPITTAGTLALSASSTGSGAVVLATTPTISNLQSTGILTASTINASGAVTVSNRFTVTGSFAAPSYLNPGFSLINTNSGNSFGDIWYQCPNIAANGNCTIGLGKQNSTNNMIQLMWVNEATPVGYINLWGSTYCMKFRPSQESTSATTGTCQVPEGGLGVYGNVYTGGSVSLRDGNFTVDRNAGGTGGLETHEGDVFRYTKGSGNMELECVGHTISNLLSSQKWSRMGNMVYVYFDATFDIDAGVESELVWSNLPAIPLGTACAPMSLQTDLEPSAIMITKKYVVEADPVMGARFYRVGNQINGYQGYTSAQTGVRVSGMLTYPADETF